MLDPKEHRMLLEAFAKSAAVTGTTPKAPGKPKAVAKPTAPVPGTALVGNLSQLATKSGFDSSLATKIAEQIGKLAADEPPCPGGKIRSKGMGRGLGIGKGKGPIGIPVGEKMKALGEKDEDKDEDKDKKEEKSDKKEARDMPHFTEQDRPEKTKDIYRALKREHPGMPAGMKARIAARQGKPGKQQQGPPYKGPLTKQDSYPPSPEFAKFSTDWLDKFAKRDMPSIPLKEKKKFKGGEPASKAPAGEGGRFKALVQKLSSLTELDVVKEAAKVRDPKALAAAIGRKKFGKQRFQEMAAAGRRKSASANSMEKQAIPLMAIPPAIGALIGGLHGGLRSKGENESRIGAILRGALTGGVTGAGAGAGLVGGYAGGMKLPQLLKGKLGAIASGTALGAGPVLGGAAGYHIAKRRPKSEKSEGQKATSAG